MFDHDNSHIQQMSVGKNYYFTKHIYILGLTGRYFNVEAQL